jgi:hypothetical protein
MKKPTQWDWLGTGVLPVRSQASFTSTPGASQTFGLLSEHEKTNPMGLVF